MLCYGLLFVMWCEMPPPPPPVDTYCQNTRFFQWSAADTRRSKEQMDTSNRVREAICTTH